MKNQLKIIKEIIRDNPEDLPLQYSVINDKISIDKKKRYYIERRSINIPKHDISIVKTRREHYKGRFIFETKYDTDRSYHIKYKGEIIHINKGDFDRLDHMWYYTTEKRRKNTKQQINI